MVCGIIWADGVALRGAEAAVYYKELGIFAIETTFRESINIR